MDFQTLARRDLQALCKRNKIPANMTNLAMAEALQALDLVEGIDEIMQPSQSGTAQSSSESFDMADVTSPFVPQTAGRSTRRANIPKPAPESVNPTTRTRRTTRKTQVKDADAIETPAPMSQANRKKVQTASACLNMESQLMECEDTDTKDALATPAPIGTTTRRSRVDESAAKRVYSTRRSARLAVKSNVETLTDGSQGFKKGFTDKDGVDNFNELSGFSDESEVVSIGKEESEVVSDQKSDATIGEGIKMGSYALEEAKFEKEKCDYEEEMSLNVSNEVQQKNVEKSIEELKPGEEESSEVQQDFVDNESRADGNTGFNDEIMKELNNDIIMNGGSRDAAELALQLATKDADSEYVDSLDIIVQLNENEANKVESLQLEEIEKAAADPVQSDESFADLSTEIEVFPLEDTEMSAEPVPSDQQCADFSELIPESAVDVEGSVDLCVTFQPAHLSPSKDSASVTMKGMTAFSENIESGTNLVVMRDDDVKMAEKSVDDELLDMSMRKLTKMLKEKLEITKKPSKNENDNKATARTALQVLSENQMVE